MICGRLWRRILQRRCFRWRGKQYIMEDRKKEELPSLNWFPGHMAKARRLISDNLKLVDVAVELLDARIPLSSANPLLREITAGRPTLIALNKADLADERQTRAWTAYFRRQGFATVAIDSMSGKGLKQLTRMAAELARPKTDKLVAKGAKARSARLMIVGIPNVGKSSLINRLAGAVKAKAENRPGVTRTKQWIRIAQGLELLDMPGILWPKFEDPVVGLHLAFTGAISDEVYDLGEITCLLLARLREDYPDALRERFNLSELSEDNVQLLEAVARKRGCLLKGGAIDYEKAERMILSEFRAGRLGRITLDRLPQADTEEA